MMPQQQVGGRNVERYQKYTPQQMNLHQQQYGFVGPDSYLYQLAQGDPQLMQEMERGSLRQFTGQMGNLSSRFSGAGTGGRHSSGFKNAAGMEARQLQESLTGQRHNMRNQAIQSLMGLSNTILNQDPYDTFLVEPKKKWWESVIPALSPVAGAAIGASFGNPALGAQVGSAFGNAFTGGYG